MESYKQEYNNLLKRYYNGCKYLSENPKEIEKFMPELLKILENINIIIVQNDITNKDIMLKGFKS